MDSWIATAGSPSASGRSASKAHPSPHQNSKGLRGVFGPLLVPRLASAAKMAATHRMSCRETSINTTTTPATRTGARASSWHSAGCVSDAPPVPCAVGAVDELAQVFHVRGCAGSAAGRVTAETVVSIGLTVSRSPMSSRACFTGSGGSVADAPPASCAVGAVDELAQVFHVRSRVGSAAGSVTAETVVSIGISVSRPPMSGRE